MQQDKLPSSLNFIGEHRYEVVKIVRGRLMVASFKIGVKVDQPFDFRNGLNWVVNSREQPLLDLMP